MCVCVGGGAKLCPKVAQSLAHLTLTDGMSYAVTAAMYVTNSLTEQILVNFLLAFNFIGGRKLVAKHFAFETHEDLVCCFCPNGAC